MKLYNIALKTIVISAEAIVTVFVKSQNNPKTCLNQLKRVKVRNLSLLLKIGENNK